MSDHIVWVVQDAKGAEIKGVGDGTKESAERWAKVWNAAAFDTDLAPAIAAQRVRTPEYDAARRGATG